MFAGASVYGGAEVYGESVKVAANSEVYGGVTISDYNNLLRAHEEVKIFGYAQVSGEAVIIGGMTVSCQPPDIEKDKTKKRWTLKNKNYGPCTWNGKEEHKRAAQELYYGAVNELANRMDECWGFDTAAKSAKDLLYPDATEPDRLAAIANLGGCEHIKTQLNIGKTFVPSTFETALGLLLGLASAVRWGLYMRSLVTIASSVGDMKQLRQTGTKVAEILADIEEGLRKCRSLNAEANARRVVAHASGESRDALALVDGASERSVARDLGSHHDTHTGGASRPVGARNRVVAGQAACLYSLIRPSQRCGCRKLGRGR